jgi:ribonuclease-3
MQDLDRLQRGLDYQFQDLAHLQQALTHRSVGARNNERLEFLGDAVLGVVVAESLYQRFPQAEEGVLSRLRAQVVRRESLAVLARELDLGAHLQLGEGERKSGGWRRDSILADAMEAVIGAVYLDSDFQTARQWLLARLETALAPLAPEEAVKDPKTRLQEWLQGRQWPLPNYVLLEERGEAHARQFRVACRIESSEGSRFETYGESNSRRRAEQVAAEAALIELDA